MKVIKKAVACYSLCTPLGLVSSIGLLWAWPGHAILGYGVHYKSITYAYQHAATYNNNYYYLLGHIVAQFPEHWQRKQNDKIDSMTAGPNRRRKIFLMINVASFMYVSSLCRLCTSSILNDI